MTNIPNLLSTEDQLMVSQTYLDNLVIFSRKNPFTAQSAYSYLKAVRRASTTRKVAAVSLELDKNIQPILDQISRTRPKVNYETYPNFAFTINHCIEKGIPLFASDVSYPVFISELERQNDIFRKYFVSGHPTPLQLEAITTIYEPLENQRAKEVSERLKNLSADMDGLVLHLASYDQALRLGHFLGTSFSS